MCGSPPASHSDRGADKLPSPALGPKSTLKSRGMLDTRAGLEGSQQPRRQRRRMGSRAQAIKAEAPLLKRIQNKHRVWAEVMSPPIISVVITVKAFGNRILRRVINATQPHQQRSH